jgi:hypothetical protein
MRNAEWTERSPKGCAFSFRTLHSELRAQIGGSPRCCPVLCGLRDHCIAAMLATLVPVWKDRDTKAELNRRSQACEGPDRHRCSRRVKWSERGGNAPSCSCSRSRRLTVRLRSEKLPAH